MKKALHLLIALVFVSTLGFSQSDRRENLNLNEKNSFSGVQSERTLRSSLLKAVETAKIGKTPQSNRVTYRGVQVCDSVLRLDFDASAQPTGYGPDADSIVVEYIDNDTILINHGYTGGADYASTWYLPTDNADSTNKHIRVYGWLQNELATNSDWLFLTGITIPDSGATLTWKHRMVDKNYRNAYRVFVYHADILGGAITPILTYTDNDAGTDGDTLWTPQTAEIPAEYAGVQNVSIVFDHNAAGYMAIIDFDDIELVSCYTAASASPVLSFSTDKDTIFVGDSIEYTDESSNDPTAWSWTFDGGTPSSSSEQNETVTYNTAGTYSTTLVVSNAAGQDSLTTQEVFHVIENEAPQGDTAFTYCVGDDIADLMVTPRNGGTITWYSDETLLLDESIGESFETGVSNLIAGETCFYATEKLAGLETVALEVCITVNDKPNAPVVLDHDDICEGEGSMFEAIAPTGSVRWYTDAALTNEVGLGDVYTPTGTLDLGLNTIYFTETVNGCASDVDSATITKLAKDTASFYYPSATYCKDGSNPVATIDGTTGGTFSASSLDMSVNSSTGEIDLALTDTGAYAVTYITNGTCPDTMTSPLVKIISSPDATFSYAKNSYCASEGVITPTVANIGIFSVTPSGLSINVSTGEIDLAASDAGDYTVVNTIIGGVTNCDPDTATFDLTVVSASEPTVSGAINLCVDAAVAELTATANNNGRLVWYSDEALTDSIGAGETLSNAYTTASTDTIDFYVVEKNGACMSDASKIEVSITGSLQAPSVLSQVDFCQGETSDFEVVNGGSTINWYDDAAATSLVNTGDTYFADLSDAGSATLYLVATNGSCASDTTAYNYMVYAMPDAPIATQPSDYDNGDAIADLEVTGNGGNFTWYSDANLTTVVGNGTPFASGVNSKNEGTTCFYVTESNGACESDYDEVCITVLAADTTDQDTIITGGGTYDTTITTSCGDTILHYDFDGGDYVDSSFVSKSEYGFYVLDRDQQTWNGYGASYGWTPFYVASIDIAGTDTNRSLMNQSYHDSTHIAADNWFMFGPVIMKEGSMTLRWKHLFPDQGYRDGYRIMINKEGFDPAYFEAGEELFKVSDNDIATENDTAWVDHEIIIDEGTYGNDTFYIALNHTAKDMWRLHIDDVILESCVSDTVIDTLFAPVANFVAANTTINEGQSVTFFDDSDNTPTSWSWRFPGGTPSTSTSQNPNITYSTSGNYDVTLIVSNAYGTDSITKSNYVTVQKQDTSGTYTAPIANFTQSATQIQVGSSVTFTDASLNDPTAWSWSFQGGSPANSSNSSETVTYNAVGEYDVTLNVSNPAGSDVKIKVGLIVVVDTTLGPVANFDADAVEIFEEEFVNFYDASENSPAAWSWVFEGADPPTSKSQNPTNIQYNTAGTFDVRLTVSNMYGMNSVTKSDFITVNVFTDVEDGFSGKILLFPNPSNGFVNIDISSADLQESTIVVYNMTGQRVYAQQINIDNNRFRGSVNLSELPKGVYSLNVLTESGVIMKEKVVIE